MTVTPAATASLCALTGHAKGRAARFHLGISGFSLDLCRNAMGVTAETALGRVGGDGEGPPAEPGCWQCHHQRSVACAGAGREPAGPALFALAPPPALSPKPACSAQPPPLSGEDAVARTPLPCLSLRADPPMGKQRDETVRKPSPRKVLAKSSLW